MLLKNVEITQTIFDELGPDQLSRIVPLGSIDVEDACPELATSTTFEVPFVPVRTLSRIVRVKTLPTISKKIFKVFVEFRSLAKFLKLCR